jgi:hypothetical protein
MKQFATITAAGTILAGVVATPLAWSAQAVPCENMLKDLRAAVDAAKLSDADAAKVKELEDKGIERCNADDDKRADDFFSQAMKIVSK